MWAVDPVAELRNNAQLSVLGLNNAAACNEQFESHLAWATDAAAATVLVAEARQPSAKITTNKLAFRRLRSIIRGWSSGTSKGGGEWCCSVVRLPDIHAVGIEISAKQHTLINVLPSQSNHELAQLPPLCGSSSSLGFEDRNNVS